MPFYQAKKSNICPKIESWLLYGIFKSLKIKISIKPPQDEEIRISADGQTVWQEKASCPVSIEFSNQPVRITSLVPENWCFYQVAQQKLGWNLQPN